MNIEKLDSELGRLSEEIRRVAEGDLFNVRPAMPEIEQVLIRSTEKSFQVGGRYSVIGSGEFAGGSEKWEPSKRVKKRGGQTLVDEGILAASITARSGDDYVEYGTNRVQGAILHYGGDIDHPGGTPYIVIGGRAKFLRKDGEYPAGVKFTRPHTITLPPRPYLVVQDEDFEEISFVIADTINQRT